MKWSVGVFMLIGVACAGAASAQDQEPVAPAAAIEQAQAPDSRAAAIADAERAKAEHMAPAAPGKAEAYVTRISDIFLSGEMHWHAFWQNAYSGGGFTLGAGYSRYVSSYNLLDVRGSITFSGYKRMEAEFLAPELFGRRGTLSVLGGWREATAVNFYGLGQTTKTENLVNYGFKQPYLSANLEVFPAKKLFTIAGGDRGVAVEPGRRLRRRRRRSSRTTRPRRCRASARRRSTSTHRRRSASTRGRRAATRGAAASTA